MANKISVVLDVATDKAISGLKGFKQSVADADGAMGKVKAGSASAFGAIKQNAGLAGVAVVGAVGAMAAKSIEAASRLGESVNAVNVTFGSSAEGIKALGEQAAESVGLSNSAFNGLAVQFSSFATTVAGEGGDVVSTIDEMTHRAADFASVMNVEVADAAAMFQSGLAGETEPLKKFGIDLSAAAVEAHALATGIVKTGETMTEAQKVQARYSLLMEQTEKTAGDFANTSDGLANSQRILAAKLEDTAAKVGKDLAPALAVVTTVLSDLIPIAGTMAAKVGDAFVAMTDAAYAFGSGVAAVADALPWVDLAGPELGVTLHEWAKLERATADLVAEFAKGAPTYDEFVAAMEAAGHSVEEVSLAKVAYRKQLDGVTDATGAVIEVTEDLVEVVDYTAMAEEEAAEMIDEVNKTFDEQTEAAEAATEALNDQIDALTGLVGGDIAVRDAQREAAAAVDELRWAMDAGELSAEGLAAQQDATAASVLGAAEAAAAYEEELLAANGTVLSAQGQQDLLRRKLEELATTLDPGSPLLTQIQGYIDALNSIPTEIDTRIRATGGGATVGLLPQIGGPRAAGGPVSAGTSYLVGEQGMELFTPSVNGFITPHNALVGGWPSSGSAAAGGGGFPDHMTLIVEGEPITARIVKHDRELASAMRAGRR